MLPVAIFFLLLLLFQPLCPIFEPIATLQSKGLPTALDKDEDSLANAHMNSSSQINVREKKKQLEKQTAKGMEVSRQK